MPVTWASYSYSSGQSTFWCMASSDCDYESGLQHEFGSWSSIGHSGSSIDFSSQPRYMKVELKGTIVWSIQALPQDDSRFAPPWGRKYSFNIKDVRVRNRIERGEDVNAVEQLLQRVVGYLAFLGSSCIVCGRPRFLEVPLTSTCGNICRARRLAYAAGASCATKDDKCIVWERREQFVRCKFPDTERGREALRRLLDLKVVSVAIDAKTKENEIGYELAAQKVARLENCRDVASKLGVEFSSLWSADEET